MRKFSLCLSFNPIPITDSQKPILWVNLEVTGQKPNAFLGCWQLSYHFPSYGAQKHTFNLPPASNQVVG